MLINNYLVTRSYLSSKQVSAFFAEPDSAVVVVVALAAIAVVSVAAVVFADVSAVAAASVVVAVAPPVGSRSKSVPLADSLVSSHQLLTWMSFVLTVQPQMVVSPAHSHPSRPPTCSQAMRSVSPGSSRAGSSSANWRIRRREP